VCVAASVKKKKEQGNWAADWLTGGIAGKSVDPLGQKLFLGKEKKREWVEKAKGTSGVKTRCSTVTNRHDQVADPDLE